MPKLEARLRETVKIKSLEEECSKDKGGKQRDTARGNECKEGKRVWRTAGSRTEVCRAGKAGGRVSAGEKICHGEKPIIRRTM